MRPGGAGRENFPVGSGLIRAGLRPAVAAFYRFARGADDAADDPGRPAAARLAALGRFEAGLDGDPGGAPEGLALRAALATLGRPEAARHARRLLAAFRWDARGGEVAEWRDLAAYCRSSADPVGRFLLAIHGEAEPEAEAASDRLCTALQVLNHVQDMGPDHRRLGRCYLPADWLSAEGAARDDLGGAALTPALRRVADRALDRCDDLLAGAAALPARLASRRLAGEAEAILRLGRGLSARLRRGDPLAGRIAPSRLDFAAAGLWGAWRAVAPRRGPARGLARGGA